MTSLADKLQRPYYAATFENVAHTSADEPASVSDQLVSLATRQPGFLGLETARGQDGRPLTVSYWRDMADIETWKNEGHQRLAANTNGTAKLPLEVRKVGNQAH